MAFGDNLKTTLLKTIEALGKGASSLAEGAQQKLSEINMETRRRELTDAIAPIVMELYRSGADLPGELPAMLEELSELEEKLSALRAAREKQPEPAEQEAEEAPAQETEETPVEEAAEPTLEENPVVSPEQSGEDFSADEPGIEQQKELL